MENVMTNARPGGGLKTEKAPGHWVLARTGKRVLRPGGMELTRRLLEEEGFEVKTTETAPMALLEPARVLRDEGLFGALRFAFNVLRDRDARRRVFAMRRVFRRRRDKIAAVVITAVRV